MFKLPFSLSETTLRIVIFGGVLMLMALLEAILPRRNRAQPRSKRWTTNLAMILVDSAALRVALPVVAIGTAALAIERGWGFFQWVAWPAWLEISLSIIVLDMLIYWQHVATHRIPLLWRLHKVHHSDRDIDVTTGVRFHPIEIVLSMLYKMLCVALIGPAVAAVLIFEVLLNASALFNHANIHLPQSVDRWLRLLVVTPDMHRVHHSANPIETDRNFGFALSIWDRLFGSYQSQPQAGHNEMTIGLSEHQDEQPAGLWWALSLPFRTTQHHDRESP